MRRLKMKFMVLAFSHILMSVIALFPSAGHAEVKSVEVKCGISQFHIEEIKSEEPLITRYRIYGKNKKSGKAKKTLYKSDEGDWLYASCIASKSGEKYLVFQSSCSGSVCVDDKYGIVDSENLKMIIRPSNRNTGNATQVEKILGMPAPTLMRDKNYDCCK